jgi:hypothetical protein
MRHIGKLCAVMVPAVALTVALTGGPAQAKFTHNSTLTRGCTIHENYPLAGLPARNWNKPIRSPRGTRWNVGVRYTVDANWALVLDYAHPHDPQWGFIERSCLTDPFAYNFQETQRLPDRFGSGGGTGHPVKPVPFDIQPRTVRKTIHVGSGSVGTLRSAPSSFVIGNIRGGDPFQISRTTCGRHNPNQWILGGAPNSGRWGYVQARHLPACL